MISLSTMRPSSTEFFVGHLIGRLRPLPMIGALTNMAVGAIDDNRQVAQRGSLAPTPSESPTDQGQARNDPGGLHIAVKGPP